MIRSRFAALVAGAALASSGVAAGLVGFSAAPAGAATTYVVDNATDIGAAVPTNCTTPVAGACRLVDAMAAADAVDGDVVVSLAAPGGVIAGTGDTYNGGAGAGNHTLTIEGNGQTVDSTATGAATLRVFGGTLVVNDLTIESAYTAINGSGNIAGNNCLLLANVGETATTSQGIYSGGGTITLHDCLVDSNNVSDGDAVGVDGSSDVTLVNSTIDANSSAASGVAVQSRGGDIEVIGSTITGTGGQDGRGIANGNSVTAVNSTIANSSGFGIDTEGAVTLAYVDVIGNAQDEGTVQINATSLTVFGSVIAQPGSGNANCNVSQVTSEGYNYSDDADASSSCKLAHATDRVGAANDPLLSSLQNNGGRTPTFLPQTGSPLIDAIPADACQTGAANGVTTDQRGLPRPAISPGGIALACDIGSVEVQPETPVVPEPVAIQPAFTG